jgi:hypothetical protein
MSTIGGSLGVLVFAAVVSGCASEPPMYIRYTSNAGATQQQFMKDRHACYSETHQWTYRAAAYQPGGGPVGQARPPCSPFNACLVARGYSRSDTPNAADLNQSGSLYVPRGAEYQCVE